MDANELAMTLIAGAGDSKSYAMEAIYNAKDGNFVEARACIGQARDALVSTHDLQTELIRGEMSGESKTEVTLLMLHAQDHLMSAITTRELAEEIIELYERLSKA
jgi:PTS system cellobiose-specific IIA component